MSSDEVSVIVPMPNDVAVRGTRAAIILTTILTLSPAAVSQLARLRVPIPWQSGD